MTWPRMVVAARAGFGGLRADLVLGWRVAARHAAPRVAFGWTVGLAALTRVATGPAPDAAAPVLVSLAGLIAAAAGPRSFVRGGPFESLRWIGIPPTAAVLARLGGAVAIACLGATAAAVAVGGPMSVGPRALVAGAAHAAVIAAVTGALTPSFGCTTATLLSLLLVAVGVGAPYAAFVLEAGPPAAPLRPPGPLAIGLLDGGLAADLPEFLVWLGLGLGGVRTLTRSMLPREDPTPPGDPCTLVYRRVSCPARAADAERPALQDVSLTVEGGEIVAFIGVPADGPSTMLRAAARLLAPTRGAVGVCTRRAAPRGFGYVRAGLTGPEDVTVAEWLRYVADQRGGPPRARAMRVQAALALVGLGDCGERRIGLLDRGQAERLAVATGAASAAPLVMLDDSFAGVDAATRRALTDALADLAVQGRTILLAPRDVRAVEAVATRVVVLRDGRVLADLRMTTLQRERVAELRLNGAALASVARISAHFPDAVRTGLGVDVPLAGGRTLESVLALCRSERIPVLGSRVRYRAVEDLLAPGRPTPDPERAALV